MEKNTQIVTSLYLSQMPFIVFKADSYTASVWGGLNFQVLNNHCSKMALKMYSREDTLERKQEYYENYY